MASNGLKETLAAMERVKQAAKEAAMEQLIKCAEQTAAAMRQLAPEDEGDLKESITVTLPGQSTPPYSQPGGNRVAAENEVIITAGSEDVRYPHMIEHGTSKMDAQPYFWPAYRLFRDKIKRQTAAAFGRTAKREWNR